ncbi:fibrinogen-like protein A [Culex pipiens pallens]|uniref:fibrinogen-like protein A n=1 Tax=Culex pipiens pallens TaxID=42434 RepID=UPI0019541611|nr:fibrinogen-like protein A [Culex pipiens pallens]
MAVRNFPHFLMAVVMICKSVYSLDTNISSVESVNAGFGYELVQARLDSLQFSFLELFVHVKELGETVLNNQRTIEQGQLQSNQLVHRHQKQITDRVEDLENGVSANVSLISNYAKQILDLQTICANHDLIKEELYKMKQNVTFNFETPKKSNNNLSNIESCQTAKSSTTGLFKMTIANIVDPVTVFCEMQRFGGGWLVFQQRFDGSVDFYRGWNEYKAGFGSVGQEFWLGLEAIHQITKQGTYEMIVELEDFKGNYSYARYSEFAVGSEAEKYALQKLGSCSGTAGDYLSYHKGMKFTTRDSDNDEHSANCAVNFHGAWWYNGCHRSNLNGEHSKENNYKTINWFNSGVGLKYSRMMIRKT